MTHWRYLATKFTSSLVVLKMDLSQRIYNGENPGQLYCIVNDSEPGYESERLGGGTETPSLGILVP